MSESKQDVEDDPENPVLINLHEEKLIQYETFMEQKANKTVFGRGLKHKVEGERPTSFFMNLEKNRNAQRYISTLSVERGGVETTSPIFFPFSSYFPSYFFSFSFFFFVPLFLFPPILPSTFFHVF